MQENLQTWVVVIAALGTITALTLAGKRVVFLARLITSGQPAPGRIEGVTGRIGQTLKTQLVEVFGQRKLLTWSVPGVAHAFVFYAFVILGTVYVEAYGILISRNPEWEIPLIGDWAVLGFAQDLIAVLALVGIVAFARIRLANTPAKLGRGSRFAGSHLGGAYLVLFQIFNVIWTLFLFRGAAAAHGTFPYGDAAFVSSTLGRVLPDSATLVGIGLLLHIGIMLVFLVEVVNSKHLHIFIAPLNVAFKRQPVALGAAKPLINNGKAITLDDVEDLDEDAKLGIGAIEDFSWKGLLDMATCTECGRCQSQCPAWNTEKPLSPKMLILNLRDHAFAKAPYLLADGDEAKAGEAATKEAERPLIGDESMYGVIDPDVLWSCVTCGACVQQCPVDIEHVDHILDMRRYQVLVESNFPAELNGLFKGMENKGNPWNMSPTARLDWAKGLDFEVKVVGEDIESLDEVEWLFWVGCAGAYEDRAKKTTRAVAELLDMAGVSFGVLGNGETCTGDQARRAGNEFVFQGLAQQNVETFKEFKVKKVVSTCAHCFNTLKNEYKDFGIELEVVHHTQLLNRLVREGKLTPVASGAGAQKRSITYHDPCYVGRHNQVYEPPRELLQVLPGAEYVEMPRNSERSFCCGAGGARMWMEENIGTRINQNRSDEAVATGADQIAVGCPFCRVMLSDGLTAAQDNGSAREHVEVLDVAQMLLASVKGEQATKLAPGQTSGAAPTARSGDVATKAEPEAGDVTITENTVTATADAGPAAKASGGSSLFDTPAPTEDKPAAPASGGSLFDTPAPTEDKPAAPASGGSLFDTPAAVEEKPAPAASSAPAAPASGGSLFDLQAPADPEPAAPAAPAAEPEAEAKAEPAAEPAPAVDLSSGGSLFDLPAPSEPEAPAAAATPEATVEAKTEPDVAEPTEAPAPEPAPAAPAAPAAQQKPLDLSGSLFDIAAPATVEAAAPSAPAAAPEPVAEPAAEEPADDEPADDEAAAEETVDDEPAAEQPVAEEKKPAAPPVSSGEAHTPRTDVQIGEGSLFDI